MAMNLAEAERMVVAARESRRTFGVARGFWTLPVPAHSAPTRRPKVLAAIPPMGWNDWAHYQCDYTEQTILANARAR